MRETRAGIPHSEEPPHITKIIDPEITIIEEFLSEERTTIQIKVSGDNKGLKVIPDLQTEDPELHQDYQLRQGRVFQLCCVKQHGCFFSTCLYFL